MSTGYTADSYGAITPLSQPTKPSLSNLLRMKDFLAEWLVPSFLFFTTTIVFAYGFITVPPFCMLWLTFWLGACALMIAKGPGVYYNTRVIGLLSLLSLVLGAVVGLYIYDEAAIFPPMYANTRKYTNVVPSQNAQSVGDAGQIVFSAETFVDTSKAAGLVKEDGTKYCVAPIRDNSGLERVQFWAVGVNCCGSTASFSCDDVGVSGAQAGVVVFENNQYFMESRFERYKEARRKAEAAWSLSSVTNPLYVRWVTIAHLDKLANYYRAKALLLLFGTGFVYLLFALFCAYSVYQKPGLEVSSSQNSIQKRVT